jgi:mgtE-like transporter
MRLLRRIVARFVALVRADASGVRAGFVALCVSAATGLIAGLTLGSISGTLESLPGLLVLVPAAIGMRGNVFGALGSRLGTTIHTGTFRPTLRRDSVVGQNIAAAFSLSIAMALLLAVLAKVIAVAFGVQQTIGIADFVVVSVLGGALSSIALVGITVFVASLSARRGWDLDNVAAPIVTSAGDVATLPSLWLATIVAGRGMVTGSLSIVLAAVALVGLAQGWRSRRTILRGIVRESLPVLAIAGLVDVVAGLTVEKRLGAFSAFPALLVIVPPFLGQSGALGGILVSRIATKLHLGLVRTDRFRLRGIGEDIALVALYALPVYLLVGLSSDLVSALSGLASPGAFDVIGIAMVAGLATFVMLVVIASAVAIAAHRLGLDPDNHGIPVVTSSLDLFGSIALILAIVSFGLG